MISCSSNYSVESLIRTINVIFLLKNELISAIVTSEYSFLIKIPLIIDQEYIIFKLFVMLKICSCVFFITIFFREREKYQHVVFLFLHMYYINMK